MTQKPTSRPDLDQLRDRITITWQYLRTHIVPDPTNFVQKMDGVVDRVTLSSSLRQLRVLRHDLDECITALRAEQMAELEALLAGTFGSATKTADDDDARRQRIVKRGRIRTADEYRLISARVEVIYEDPSHGEELEILNGRQESRLRSTEVGFDRVRGHNFSAELTVPSRLNEDSRRIVAPTKRSAGERTGGRG